MLKQLLFFLILVSQVFLQVSAQDCGELVLRVRDLNATAFDEYHQLNDMKQDALLILYSRERATCPEEVSSISIFTIKFVNDFETAYNLSKNTDGQYRVDALENSLKLSDLIQSQQKIGISAESQGIIDSASRALKEFLLVQAKIYATNAEGVTATGEKLFNYKKATEAYQGAGETIEAENLRLKWLAIEKVYLGDLNAANELISRGDSKYELANPLVSGDIFSKVEAYILARSASLDYSQALVYYNFHTESAKVSMTTERIAAVSETMNSLRRTIVRYYALSFVSLMGLAMYLLNRLKSWHGDTYDYSLGNELVRVSASAD